MYNSSGHEYKNVVIFANIILHFSQDIELIPGGDYENIFNSMTFNLLFPLAGTNQERIEKAIGKIAGILEQEKYAEK